MGARNEKEEKKTGWQGSWAGKREKGMGFVALRKRLNEKAHEGGRNSMS